MDIYLSHQSAVDFWRNCASTSGFTKAACADVSNAYAGSRAADEFGLTRFGIRTACVHVLVGEHDKRSRSKTCMCHCQTRRLPKESFYQIASHVYVTSPELTLVHMSHAIDRLELLKLTCEFCGRYRMNVLGSGFENAGIEPLTSIKELRQYLKRYGLTWSKADISAAAKHAFDNSCSPMESAVALLLCLPRGAGGYGMPRPELNAEVQIPDEHRYWLGRDHLRCDLMWKKDHVALEYDSKEWHSEVAKIEEDAVRRNVLEGKGYRMLTATSEQVMSASGFDLLARVLAKMLGYRMRAMPDGWRSARDKARRILLPHGVRA